MKFAKFALLLMVIAMFSCASTYKSIDPNSLNYRSKSMDKNVTFVYKYELLSKKYKKKEISKGVRLVAVKLFNDSGKDLVFGKDIKLFYDDGTSPYIMENESVFKSLKQSPASYLWYLLLTPLNLYTTSSHNGYNTQTSALPIGLVIGPAFTASNIVVASKANKKLRQNLLENNLNGVTIKAGTTVSGLIGIRSDDYNALRIRVE